jgi:hypothetical protein
LLWKPGAKLISIAKPPFLALGDLVTFGPYPGVYRVVAEARSMARISDARFKYQSEFPTWAARYRYLVDASDPALEWAFSLQQY